MLYRNRVNIYNARIFQMVKRKGGGVNKFIRKDLTGVGQADARYRLAVDMVATEEKCWWVNRWLIGNRPLNAEKPR